MGDKVTLIGFGTFSVSARAAREGRNPQTGDTIQIPARKIVKFKAGIKLFSPLILSTIPSRQVCSVSEELCR